MFSKFINAFINLDIIAYSNYIYYDPITSELSSRLYQTIGISENNDNRGILIALIKTLDLQDHIAKKLAVEYFPFKYSGSIIENAEDPYFRIDMNRYKLSKIKQLIKENMDTNNNNEILNITEEKKEIVKESTINNILTQEEKDVLRDILLKVIKNNDVVLPKAD